MSSQAATELLSPAGSFETARAAFAAGADAVYLGLNAFSARAEAENFTPETLRQLLGWTRPRGKKVYVAFNTLLDDASMPAAVEQLSTLADMCPDGLIVQDLGVARIVHRHFPELSLHASTQLVAHNLEGVLALKALGFVRVVLARELTLADMRTIAQRCGVEIEVFVHGALCYSLSGLCLFSALEKDRSGNKGRCAYCCRLGFTDAAGRRSYPFSMRDLRLDDSLDRLRDAGIASLKIEGRMKSALYVASVTRRYRDLLDGRPPSVSRADLETVFSRRTTSLYLNGAARAPEDVIDPVSLGHLGTPIGTVKRITKDREGRLWLRLHTLRTLERHDGMQFAAPEGGKPVGFGIGDMRNAIARKIVFEVPADTDVEIRVPDSLGAEARRALHHGATVFCSASSAVRRRFPIPPFRPSAVQAGKPLNISVTLAPSSLTAESGHVRIVQPCSLEPAQHPEQTPAAVRRAFSKLGDTRWTLGALTVEDPHGLFAPASILNDIRRRLISACDKELDAARAKKIAAILATPPEGAKAHEARLPMRILKMRINQDAPVEMLDSHDEIVVAIGHLSGKEVADSLSKAPFAAVRAKLRLALPVFTRESDFSALRATVKHLLREGYAMWEAADLAGARLLASNGVTSITSDWTLYSHNRFAADALAELGAERAVASPECDDECRKALAARNGPPVFEFLERQSTPLFISVTRPATDTPEHLATVNGTEITSFENDGLWVTTRTEPRIFNPPPGVSVRLDISWDAP